jgi:hypothetical protein
MKKLPLLLSLAATLGSALEDFGPRRGGGFDHSSTISKDERKKRTKAKKAAKKQRRK